MIIENTANDIRIVADPAAAPTQVTLAVQGIVLARMTDRDLHDLIYCAQRTLTQLELIEQRRG